MRQRCEEPLGKQLLQQENIPWSPRIPQLLALPKRGVDIAYFEEVVANVTMKTSCLPFGYPTNKSPVSISTPGKSLIDTDFVSPDFPLHIMQKMSRQTTVRPAPRKIDGCKKHPPIWSVREHIVNHDVAIIPTIHCMLTNPFIRALDWERHTVHETNDIVYQWFPLLDHGDVFNHPCLIRELHSSHWMTPK